MNYQGFRIDQKTALRKYARQVPEPGGGTGCRDPHSERIFFYQLFNPEFLHRQDLLLLLNWLACFCDGEPLHFATNLIQTYLFNRNTRESLGGLEKAVDSTAFLVLPNFHSCFFSISINQFNYELEISIIEIESE